MTGLVGGYVARRSRAEEKKGVGRRWWWLEMRLADAGSMTSLEAWGGRRRGLGFQGASTVLWELKGDRQADLLQRAAETLGVERLFVWMSRVGNNL